MMHVFYLFGKKKYQMWLHAHKLYQQIHSNLVGDKLTKGPTFFKQYVFVFFFNVCCCFLCRHIFLIEKHEIYVNLTKSIFFFFKLKISPRTYLKFIFTPAAFFPINFLFNYCFCMRMLSLQVIVHAKAESEKNVDLFHQPVCFAVPCCLQVSSIVLGKPQGPRRFSWLPRHSVHTEQCSDQSHTGPQTSVPESPSLVQWSEKVWW